jgi:hypothetical protein
MDSAQTFAAYVWVLATIVSEADRTGEPKTPRKAHLAPESKHREKLISHPNQNTAKSSSRTRIPTRSIHIVIISTQPNREPTLHQPHLKQLESVGADVNAHGLTVALHARRRVHRIAKQAAARAQGALVRASRRGKSQSATEVCLTNNAAFYAR